MLDDDDAIMLDFIKSESLTAGSIRIEWSVAPRPPTLSAGLNRLWHSAKPAGIYLQTWDDYVMTTPAWDSRLREIFAALPDDRLAVVKIIDAARSSDDLILWAMSGEWANIAGQYMPPYFPFWFCDMWVDHVSSMAGRQIRSDVSARPIVQGVSPTMSMWNLPFWMRYYYALHDERVSEADKILKHIHGADLLEYLLARKDMELRAQHYLRMIESMLDEQRLRLIERRFSGDTPRPPDERYLRAETMARRHFVSLGGGDSKES
ncbi:MAG: hypothetical protein K0Q70_1297 [Rhodospirillales bacterium]|nr:hypothetical protein [Rhodospirillales bacterium]